MNKFEEEDNQRPKILSDVFESILGAILIDSNLEECFKFLDKIYKPFLIYCAKYFNNILYSPVSILTELCTKLYGITPTFIKTNNESNVTVDVILVNRIISSATASDESRAKDKAAIQATKVLKDGNIDLNNKEH
jgi:dsRNA-specific ribonuclease